MKKTLRLFSLVLSLVMLLSFATVSVSSEDAPETKRKVQYQYIKSIEWELEEEAVITASEDGFVIDNVVYDQNGNKVREIPMVSDDGRLNLIYHLDGKYAYTFYKDMYHDEAWYSTQLINAFTGKLLVDYESYPNSSWEKRFYSADGVMYLNGERVMDFEAATVDYIGGDMYVTLNEGDIDPEAGYTPSSHILYNAAEKKTYELSRLDLLPIVYFDGFENGWAYVLDNEGVIVGFVMIDRTGKPISDKMYSDFMYEEKEGGDKGVYYVCDAETEEWTLIDNGENALCTFPEGEEPHEIYERYIITVDGSDVYRVYNREDYTTDGKTYGWYCGIDSETFTVGDGTFDPATDTPDLIYNGDGSVTETALNSIIPVERGNYLVSFDYETELSSTYDRDLNHVCDLSEEYVNLFLLEYDDLLLAEKSNGKYQLVGYDGSEKYFEYDDSVDVKLMQRFRNGNLLIVIGDSEAGAPRYEVFVVSYHDTIYKDVKNGAWYLDAVNFVVDNGYMNGMSETTFAPDKSMTRAQLVTVLWRMAGSPETEFTNRFSDVKKESLWYADGVMWAAENGIVEGFPDGTFNPNSPVTRDQLAAIFYRYTEFMGGDTSASGDLSDFADNDKIQRWARPAIEWAVGAGIINGKPADDVVAIAPKAFTTRAEVATVIMRYLSE